MRTTPAVLLSAAALLAAASPAGASPSVTADQAGTDGTRATASGTAAFPALTGPQSVVGTDAGRGNGPVASSPAGIAAGLGLTDAKLGLLADGTGLRFTWVLSELPEQTPPEGVRYTWGFGIGNSAYQLSAKRSNVANVNTTEDPLGTVRHTAANTGGAFELRGACTATYGGTPVNGCYRLAYLQGRIDPATDTVSVDIPWETRDAIGRLVAPDLKPGAVVADSGVGSAGGTIQASFQAVLTVAQASNTISAIDSFYTAPQLALGIGRSTANPKSISYTTPVTLAPDGTWSGSVGGVTAVNRTVFVRACHGTACAFAQRSVD